MKTHRIIVALAFPLLITLVGCGSGGDSSACGTANQCVGVTVSGNSYSIRNACTTRISVRWCEQYNGPVCNTESGGFGRTLESGETARFVSVQQETPSIRYCAN